MLKIDKVAVIGGTGKSGKYLVKELLKQDIPFKILVRKTAYFELENPLIDVVIGDVEDYEKIIELVQDCSAIISTLGLGLPASKRSIFSESTQNIIRAMKTLQIRRYIVITGLNVDTLIDKKSPKTKFATDWMYENYPITTADKQKEYDILNHSDIDWTLVRLPLIEQSDVKGEINVSLHDCPGDRISAANLAQFLIRLLSDITYNQSAPFISNK